MSCSVHPAGGKMAERCGALLITHSLGAIDFAHSVSVRVCVCII